MSEPSQDAQRSATVPVKGGVPLQHYYVAVDTSESKLESLLELIAALRDAAPLRLVICCGSRDVLDRVTYKLRSSKLLTWCLDNFFKSLQHSDMSEREINKVVSSSMKETAIRNVGNTDLIDDNVRMENEMHEGLGIEDDMNIAALAPSTGARDNIPDATGGDTSQAQERKSISRIIVTTDPPLLAIDKSKQPIGPTLMINYQIPQRKEIYVRRISTILGSRSRSEKQRICVSFVEAAFVDDLRRLEQFAEKEIQEMPVRVGEIFQDMGAMSSS